MQVRVQAQDPRTRTEPNPGQSSLRLFVPRKGTELERVQDAIEKEWRDREVAEDRTECVEDGERSREVGARLPYALDEGDEQLCNEDVA